MRKYFVLVGVLLLTAGLALAQDFPKVETSPAFMYIRTPINFGQGQNLSFNCAGGGGTLAYNVTSALGIAADMGGCKYFGESLPEEVSSKISGSAFTYLFGPRFTYRSKSAFQPFGEINFGGARIALTANNCSGDCSVSKNAFAMTVGGGFQIKMSKKISLRPVQAEYLYTRFGKENGLNLGNQNSFRLKSGIVINWGGGSK